MVDVRNRWFLPFSTVLAWPEVAAVAEAAAEEAVEAVERSAAVGWTCTFVLAEAAVAVAASPEVTALRITRQVLRQRGAGKRRRRRCTRQEPCWARGWLTLARPPPNRPSGRCHTKVGQTSLFIYAAKNTTTRKFSGFCQLFFCLIFFIIFFYVGLCSFVLWIELGKCKPGIYLLYWYVIRSIVIICVCTLHII